MKPRAKLDPVTIREVAERAGVHLSTVSRALNPSTRGRISDEVAERVDEAARALGYSRNTLASGLRTRRSWTVGVAIPDITNPVFPPILRGIEDVLGRAGYTPIYANTDNDPERQRLVVERMRGRSVDGLILASVARKDKVALECLESGIPVVVVNRALDGAAVPCVVTDEVLGIRLAVEHLAALGHRRIAHVAGPPQLSTGHARHQAFLAAMREIGSRELDEGLVVPTRFFSEAEGLRAAASLLAAGTPFTAIVAANDLLAIGCYDALEHHGLRCPDDVSVTGFNDMPFAGRLSPPLTTVRIQHYELGIQAAQLLLRQIEEPAAPKMSVTLAPELVVRASTAPPRPL